MTALTEKRDFQAVIQDNLLIPAQLMTDPRWKGLSERAREAFFALTSYAAANRAERHARVSGYYSAPLFRKRLALAELESINLIAKVASRPDRYMLNWAPYTDPLYHLNYGRVGQVGATRT